MVSFRKHCSLLSCGLRSNIRGTSCDGKKSESNVANMTASAPLNDGTIALLNAKRRLLISMYSKVASNFSLKETVAPGFVAEASSSMKN